MKKVTRLVFLVGIVGIFFGACATMPPLPEVTPISHPIWGGVLSGEWDNDFRQEVSVVVKGFNSSNTTASIIYSWGQYTGGQRGGFLPLTAIVEKDGSMVARWNYSSGRTITLILKPLPDGSIRAEYRREGGTSNFATLRRREK
jgi:hypothetical protein